MPQSFTSLYFHLIFSTKHRTPWITSAIQPDLFKDIGGIMNNKHGKLIAAGGVADHVHLLVSLTKHSNIVDTLRDIKANSSRWIHENYPDLSSFEWQARYGAFSVSYSGINRLKAYIRNQEVHHRKVTYQDEFRKYLIRHDMEFDERYLWD